MKTLLRKAVLSSLILLSACSSSSLFISEESIKANNSKKSENMSIKSMDIDSEGNIYFVDTINPFLLKKLTPQGKIQDFKLFDKEFNFSIDNEDNFFIVSSEPETIKKFYPKTNIFEEIDKKIFDKAQHFSEPKFGKNNLYISGTDSPTEPYIYEVRDNQLVKKINYEQSILLNFFVNKYTGDLYLLYQDPNSFYYSGSSIPTYLSIIKDNKEIDITKKYNNSSFSELYPKSLTFDKAQNKYILYSTNSNSVLFKISKEDKLLKMYSLNRLSFYIIFPIFGLYIPYNNTLLIDEKRKILYYSNGTNIYKLDIS